MGPDKIPHIIRAFTWIGIVSVPPVRESKRTDSAQRWRPFEKAKTRSAT